VRWLSDHSVAIIIVAAFVHLLFFLQDIRHVLADPQATVQLSRRLAIKDEAKKYLVKNWFETFYNAARTFIEAYPLMGILGTVLAIGVGLNATGLNSDEAATRIVGDFKNAIWSTVWGLIFGVSFLVLNSVLEPSFERLTEHRKAVRDVIQTAKQTLFRRESTGAEP
jgi:biopolymer transport protein ExbB/TolQ